MRVSPIKTHRKHNNIRPTEKGQALIEFVAVFGFFLGLFILVLAVSVHYFSHNLTSHLALQGAAIEGHSPGLGQAFAIKAGNQAAPSFSLVPTTSTGSGPLGNAKFVTLTMSGTAKIPWAPFGINLNAQPRSSASAPVWEFVVKP